MKSLTKQTFKIFWQHAIEYKWSLLFSVIGLTLATGAELYKPLLYKNFFDVLAAADKGNTNNLLIILGQILLVSLFYWVMWRVAVFLVNKFESRVMSNLLNSCFTYLQQHSYQFFNNNFGGSLVRKVTRYAKSFEDIADQIFFNIGQTAFRILVITIIIFFHSKPLFFIILGWAAIYIIVSYIFIGYKMPIDIKKSEKDSETTGFLADTITNNINIKLFTNFFSEYKAFTKITDELHNIRLRSWNLGVVSDAIQGGMMILLEIAMMYTAIRLWQQDKLTIGDFVLYQSYIIQIIERMWSLARNFQRIFESIADADEMTQILITPHEVHDSPDAELLKVKNGTIRFNNVTFGYEGQHPIFKHFNLHIKPGEKVAFVGTSGGGKSTITKILFRFYDIQEGAITIDGQDIAATTQESLRSQISLVPQDPILFHRTLMENIRYAKPTASDQEVIEAAKQAHCHEFINQFPDNYNTFVGERGVKLSGGERQRVAIARAILKNAPILILDEATSSLDSESERYIQDALTTLMKGKTTIVIAHRLSTIMQMDRIIVINNGKIVEEGTHEKLLELKDGRYQKLWHIQAGNFS